MDYQQAGVDIEAGRSFVKTIKDNVESTYRPGVLGGLGGFGGCFEIPAGYRQPVLISGTDGVGTKLKIAHQTDRHHTVGIDLVAMCVNDILTAGAEPLFFLDYLATGKLEPQQLANVVQGVVEGCKQSGCALLGGETAEMPGFYQKGEYDVAGFCVGIVEKDQILDGSKVEVGDVAIALGSSGVHSNGFSLVRKIIEMNGLDWSATPSEFGGKTLGEVFLTPTQIYVKVIQAALKSGLDIHAMAHITGGGLPENLPRCLKADQSMQIETSAWEIPAVFQWLQNAGDVPSAAMWDTFNMGVGYVVIVPAAIADESLAWFQSQDMTCFKVGEVVSGQGEVLGLT
ncbi:phosphoribosylformylglycinamidine cyclo-ligase [[Limnothrix rosea] IAM M-220]|uniref:phosphoribosylformylglycinamidine cyclo-ligase n=1 Tax=[Limnothrix rosea] IAM M-220 TaxID=454133 RepID=UPI00095B0575|nr:phosphoribosylformylglycinamidine cyclo-ligase [[Limnothrix rosea] IAM M-220]OKH20034.1 phosphoribosylformylglycinamidine cyclo-ligase [[Limnothrix rosea] IAM M-220]